MSEGYKIVYEGGSGEIEEEKIEVHRNGTAGRIGRGSDGISCGDEKEILGCETQLLCVCDRGKE